MKVFDEAYFREIFDRYFDRIYNGFLRKTKASDVAQDLTQLTFIKFWEYRYSYTFELSAEVQLFRKAKLVFIDWLRKEAHQRKLMDDIKSISVAKTEPGSGFELTDTLRNALDKLPLVRKKVFIMAYLDGYSHKEIADQLKISPKTVDAHVLKALKQLRKLLALYIILMVIS